MSVDVYPVSVSRRTHAATVLVYAEAFLQIAHAIAFLVYHHVRLLLTRYAIVVLIFAEARLADAFTILIAELAFLDRAHAH